MTFQLVMQRFGNEYSPEQLYHWTAGYFRLFARNQWKRERVAPAFSVTAMNLDAKTWCRFPILNSGFSQEIELMKQFI